MERCFKIKKFKELLPGAILLIILLGIVCVVFYCIGLGIAAGANWILSLVQQISTLDTVLVIALFSGAITIIGLVVNSLIAIKLKSDEYKNKVKTEMRIKMKKPYASFVNMIFDMLSSIKSSNKMSESEIMARMVDFSKEVTLYGSNKVIKKWATYRISASKLTPADNLKQLEGILFAIRADLGLKKRGMKTGDILALFINDVDETIRKNN